jgi:hypothetical protein
MECIEAEKERVLTTLHDRAWTQSYPEEVWMGVQIMMELELEACAGRGGGAVRMRARVDGGGVEVEVEKETETELRKGLEPEPERAMRISMEVEAEIERGVHGGARARAYDNIDTPTPSHLPRSGTVFHASR